MKFSEWLCSIGFHAWRYRNPADRTCKRCGQIENQYTRYLGSRINWWEVERPGRIPTTKTGDGSE